MCCVSQLKVVATGFRYCETKYRAQGNKQKVTLHRVSLTFP